MAGLAKLENEKIRSLIETDHGKLAIRRQTNANLDEQMVGIYSI